MKTKMMILMTSVILMGCDSATTPDLSAVQASPDVSPSPSVQVSPTAQPSASPSPSPTQASPSPSPSPSVSPSPQASPTPAPSPSPIQAPVFVASPAGYFPASDSANVTVGGPSLIANGQLQDYERVPSLSDPQDFWYGNVFYGQDPQGLPLTFSSPNLPSDAVLYQAGSQVYGGVVDANSVYLRWDFTCRSNVTVPVTFQVSNGTLTASKTVNYYFPTQNCTPFQIKGGFVNTTVSHGISTYTFVNTAQGLHTKFYFSAYDPLMRNPGVIQSMQVVTQEWDGSDLQAAEAPWITTGVTTDHGSNANLENAFTSTFTSMNPQHNSSDVVEVDLTAQLRSGSYSQNFNLIVTLTSPLGDMTQTEFAFQIDANLNWTIIGTSNMYSLRTLYGVEGITNLNLWLSQTQAIEQCIWNSTHNNTITFEYGY